MAATPSPRGFKRSAVSATPEPIDNSPPRSKIKRLTTPTASAAASRSITPNGIQETMSHADPVPRARLASQADAYQISENEEGTNMENDQSMEDGSIRTLILHSVNQRIAAAFHDSESSVISFLEDTEDSKQFDMVVTLMEQLEPHTILTGSRSDGKMIDVIEAYCQEHAKCDYQIRPYKEFTFSLATARLSNLSVLSASRKSSSATTVSTNHMRSTGRNSTKDDDNESITSGDRGTISGTTRSDLNFSEEQRAKQAMLSLGCFTNLDAFLAVCAGGALIACLQRVRAVGVVWDGVPVVRDVQSIHLEKFMLLSADTLSSLQIFDAQDNASMHANKQREGLSLFGILNTCLTPIGSSLLRRWLIRPLFSIPDIEARHQAVSVLVRTDNQATVSDIGNALKKVKNVYRLFNQLEGGLGHWVTWKNTMDFLLAAVLVRNYFADIHGAETTEIYHKLMEAVDLDVFLKIATQMSERIDWDATRTEQRLQIADGVDEDIDEWRGVQGELPEILQNLAQVVARDLPMDFPFDIDCQSFPQLGYLVAIEAREDEPVGEVVPKDWIFQFRDDQAWYFRCPRTLELDDHLGDVYNKINDRSIDILEELLDDILAAQTQVLAATDTLAELDCLLAFADATQVYQLHRPQMVEDNVIKIHKGRHLLYELTMDMYVANDTLLAGGQGILKGTEETRNSKARSMMVLVSSNGSGKTAYAKQVALIIFMAQIGCFVPAVAATLGPVDKIYTRLQTQESSARAASAFMIDLGQVSQALRGATARSLLVFDEFGKGTTPEDGAGLLAGVLMHLLQRGPECPKTIAITHFHELFANQILPPHLPISFWQMETVYQDGNAGGESATLGYLYRLTPSTSLSSRAFECAAAHNVSQEVIERARFVSHHLGKFELGPIIDAITMTEHESGELKEAEELARRFLRWDLNDPLGKEETVKDSLSRMLKEISMEGRQERAKHPPDDTVQGQVFGI